MLLLAAIALGISWAASRERRVATYAVNGALTRVELHLSSGSAEVSDAGGSSVRVRRTDEVAFGRRAVETRSIRGGVLRISSRCPTVVVGECSSSYRVGVPENVPVVVATGDGDVRIASFRGSADVTTGDGDVRVDGFCGFALAVKTGGGDVRANASCSPQTLDLRSSGGDVEATVPSGNYHVDADTNGGRREVTGLQSSPSAPFEIRALSDSGDVTVRGGG